jgi:hypothetical protein
MVVTRATRFGASKLYGIFVNLQSGGFHGGAGGSWFELPVTLPSGVSLAGDPVIESDVNYFSTLYFQASDNKVYQSSGYVTLWHPYHVINGMTFPGGTNRHAPAAYGNANGEGRHAVFSRGSNGQIYHNSTNPVLVP